MKPLAIKFQFETGTIRRALVLLGQVDGDSLNIEAIEEKFINRDDVIIKEDDLPDDQVLPMAIAFLAQIIAKNSEG